jgi:hypothetical protein
VGDGDNKEQERRKLAWTIGGAARGRSGSAGAVRPLLWGAGGWSGDEKGRWLDYDKLHLSEAGHAELARRVAEAIRGAMGGDACGRCAKHEGGGARPGAGLVGVAGAGGLVGGAAARGLARSAAPLLGAGGLAFYWWPPLPLSLSLLPAGTPPAPAPAPVPAPAPAPARPAPMPAPQARPAPGRPQQQAWQGAPAAAAGTGYPNALAPYLAAGGFMDPYTFGYGGTGISIGRGGAGVGVMSLGGRRRLAEK